MVFELATATTGPIVYTWARSYGSLLGCESSHMKSLWYLTLIACFLGSVWYCAGPLLVHVGPGNGIISLYMAMCVGSCCSALHVPMQQ